MMLNSRDLTLIIMAVSMSFAYNVSFGQLGFALTGIPEANYLFTIGHAMIISTFFLLYEGRRGRFFCQASILSLLSFFLFSYGQQFIVVITLMRLINWFQADIVLNSLYEKFYKRNKLGLWSILGMIYIVFTSIIVRTLGLYFFMPQEALITFLSLVLLMSPIIIIERVAGAHIGYHVYCRVKDLLYNTSK